MLPSPIAVVLVGAGQRGARTYASYALRRPEEMRLVAVAEPDDVRRNQLGDEHNIPYKRRFRSWEDLLDAPLLGDVALICTPDDLHLQPSIYALRAGYHVLLETPIALTIADCLQLVQTTQSAHQQLIVSHALRYTAFYRALHDIIASHRVGKIISYKQDRLIPLWYSAHQFIRNPQRTGGENPILLMEGVHELDLMLWLLKEDIETVGAVGSSRYFDLSHAPAPNIPPSCVESCPIEAECPFSAVGTYLEKRYRGMPQKGFPYSVLADGDETQPTLVAAIEQTDWGKCVYHYQTQLVDHQTILIKSPSGVNVTLTINAHSPIDERTIQIDGSQGSLTAEFVGLESRIRFYDHATGKENIINFRLGPYGHGGDHGLLGNLVKVLRGEAESLTLASQTIRAHLLAFAAEEARQQDRVCHFPSYLTRFNNI
jgi:predicted dehydrogenase